MSALQCRIRRTDATEASTPICAPREQMPPSPKASPSSKQLPPSPMGSPSDRQLSAHQERLREGQRRAQELAAKEAERALQAEAAVEANRKRLEEAKRKELAEQRRRADEQAARAQKAREEAEARRIREADERLRQLQERWKAADEHVEKVKDTMYATAGARVIAWTGRQQTAKVRNTESDKQQEEKMGRAWKLKQVRANGVPVFLALALPLESLGPSSDERAQHERNEALARLLCAAVIHTYAIPGDHSRELSPPTPTAHLPPTHATYCLSCKLLLRTICPARTYTARAQEKYEEWRVEEEKRQAERIRAHAAARRTASTRFEGELDQRNSRLREAQKLAAMRRKAKAEERKTQLAERAELAMQRDNEAWQARLRCDKAVLERQRQLEAECKRKAKQTIDFLQRRSDEIEAKRAEKITRAQSYETLTLRVDPSCWRL